MNDPEFNRVQQQVELLTGRRGDGSMSAVRRRELVNLAKLPLKSSQIQAAPTQADYNSLQEDVANLFKALAQISNAYGTANIKK